MFVLNGNVFGSGRLADLYNNIIMSLLILKAYLSRSKIYLFINIYVPGKFFTVVGVPHWCNLDNIWPLDCIRVVANDYGNIMVIISITIFLINKCYTALVRFKSEILIQTRSFGCDRYINFVFIKALLIIWKTYCVCMQY